MTLTLFKFLRHLGRILLGAKRFYRNNRCRTASTIDMDPYVDQYQIRFVLVFMKRIIIMNQRDSCIEVLGVRD